MNPALRRLIGVSASMLFIIGSLVVFASLILPAARDVEELRGERSSLKATLSEQMDTVERAQKLFEEYGGISNLQDTLSKALPVEEDVPSIINQLQGIAKARGVVIDSLELKLLPLSSKEQSDALRPIGKVEVDMKVLGPYEGIKQYLDGLETNVRIMDVKDLTVDGGAGDTDTLNYEIVITAYYQA